jgi:hypothetical protein
MKWLLSFFAWLLGSAAVVGCVRSFTTASWTDWFAVIFVIVWGGIVFWVASRLEIT